jgi:hypothetical protein
VCCVADALGLATPFFFDPLADDPFPTAIDPSPRRRSDLNGELETVSTAFNAFESGAPARIQDEQCSICLGVFEAGEPCRALRCQHAFHTECIDDWLTAGSVECPLCRQAVGLSEARRGYSAGDSDSDTGGDRASDSDSDDGGCVIT